MSCVCGMQLPMTGATPAATGTPRKMVKRAFDEVFLYLSAPGPRRERGSELEAFRDQLEEGVEHRRIESKCLHLGITEWLEEAGVIPQNRKARLGELPG